MIRHPRHIALFFDLDLYILGQNMTKGVFLEIVDSQNAVKIILRPFGCEEFGDDLVKGPALGPGDFVLCPALMLLGESAAY
jgi:hypothetical protein